MSTVPRVASSLDDLKVGQVVAYYTPDEPDPSIYRITDDWDDQFRAYAVGNHFSETWESSAAFRADKPVWDGQLVILSDPPPEPVTVSRAAIDRLAESLHLEGRCTCVMCIPARALLAEVRAQEPTP